MEGLYQWIVLLHVIAAFTFALAHGVSAGVALKLRGEREIPRVQALLVLSQAATNRMYVSVFVLSSRAWPPRSSPGSGDARGFGPRSSCWC
jgi:hypothetical protein